MVRRGQLNAVPRARESRGRLRPRLSRARGTALSCPRRTILRQPGLVVLVGGDPDDRGEAIPPDVCDPAADHLDAAFTADRELAVERLTGLVQEPVKIGRAHV